MLELRSAGLYCAAGDFYIDPREPVDRAIITHAHADRACPGSRAYLTSREGATLLREIVGEAAIESVEYGASVRLGEVALSLHPAGHILGSAQVRMEHRGEVWVAAGDYRLAPDPTCRPFEPQRCHTFVTGAVFGLPIFRWPGEADVIAEIDGWWRGNREAGKMSLLYAYPLGKAQRLLAALNPGAGPIHIQAEVQRFSRIYRDQGILLPESNAMQAGSLVIAPPSQIGTAWARGFRPASDAMVSGWMRIRGTRRRRSLDRGFVFSDHADWTELLRAIDESGAEAVWVTQGFRTPLVRWLDEHGRRAVAVDLRTEVPEE